LEAASAIASKTSPRDHCCSETVRVNVRSFCPSSLDTADPILVSQCELGLSMKCPRFFDLLLCRDDDTVLSVLRRPQNSLYTVLRTFIKVLERLLLPNVQVSDLNLMHPSSLYTPVHNTSRPTSILP